MKAHTGVDVYLHPFLTSGLYPGKKSLSRSSRFILGERACQYPLNSGLGGPQSLPGQFWEKLSLVPAGIRNRCCPLHSLCQPFRLHLRTMGYVKRKYSAAGRGGWSDQECNLKLKIIVSFLHNVHNLAHNSDTAFFCPSAYFIDVTTCPVYIKCSTMYSYSNLSRTFNVSPPRHSQLNTAHASNKSEVQIDILF